MPYRIIKQDASDLLPNTQKCQYYVIKAAKPPKVDGPRKSRNAYKDTVSKDPMKKIYHNEVERQRRNKINTWITELGQLVAEEDDEDVRVLSKIQILQRACQYVEDAKKSKQKQTKELNELRTLNKSLVEENKQLKKKLKVT